jgi:hypothetical protein
MSGFLYFSRLIGFIFLTWISQMGSERLTVECV